MQRRLSLGLLALIILFTLTGCVPPPGTTGTSAAAPTIVAKVAQSATPTSVSTEAVATATRKNILPPTISANATMPVPSTPTAVAASVTDAQIGTNRLNPAPVGTAIKTPDDMLMAVIGAERPADKTMQKANSYEYKQLKEDNEFIIVAIHAKSLKPPEETSKIPTYALRIVGSKGVIHASAVNINDDVDISAKEFFGGAEVEGLVAFQVPKDEEDLVLMYTVLGQGTRYFATGK